MGGLRSDPAHHTQLRTDPHPPGDPLAPFWQRIEAALAGFAPTGRVLEIASGTGGWTRYLLEQASTITAVDSSSEMHDLSRRKLNEDPRVRYIEADVFSWKRDEQYDVVFFWGEGQLKSSTTHAASHLK